MKININSKMSMQISSLNKLHQKKLFQKSKTNKLLLTDFNKFSLFNNNLKSTKRKLCINSQQTYSNNSLKIQKNINSLNIKKKKPYIINNKITNNNNIIKSIKNNTSKNENKHIVFNNNSNSNKSLKYNSVNNLIGINISFNYMNKNYSLNKIKPNYYMPYYSTKNIKNNNKINNNINIKEQYYHKFFNESFNDVNKENNSFNSSSSKNKINKKNKNVIVSPMQNDFSKIIKSLKYKGINSPKNKNKKINNNFNKKKKQLEIKNTLSSNEENNNCNKTNLNNSSNISGIGKSLSCKNMKLNHMTIKRYKNNAVKNTYGNKNIYKLLIKSFDKKVNKLKDDYNYNNEIFDDDKLYDIINEFFIKYCNIIEDQSQKELIVNIFYQMNNIINKKDKHILLMQKEKQNLIEKNKNYKKNNEELLEQNNLLINKCNNLQKKIDMLNNDIKLYSNEIVNKKTKNSINDEENQSFTTSSYVNTEELESIRFFDKIKMKKNSFTNIPELSFQKIKIEENKNDILQIKQKNNSKNNSHKANNVTKKDKNNNCNIINKKYIYYNNSNMQPKSKKILNISYKQKNNSTVNKRNIIIVNNKQNNNGYLYIPDLKKNSVKKK